MISFENKKILITGATGGIGKELVKKFFNLGGNIVATGTKAENIASNIKELLIKQITSRVKWRESVEYMIKNGVNEFIEIGPGKILSGLVRRINKDVNIFNINSINDITNYINK